MAEAEAEASLVVAVVLEVISTFHSMKLHLAHIMYKLVLVELVVMDGMPVNNMVIKGVSLDLVLYGVMEVAVVLLMVVLETVLITLCVVDQVVEQLLNITELELVLLLLEIIFKVEQVHMDIMVEVKDLVVLVDHASQPMEEMQELVAGVQKVKVMM